MKSMELYIHYPFCARKCRYCDFLSAPADKKTQSAYIRALIREIRYMSGIYEDFMVDTVFIGGGTPSLMGAENLMALMAAVHGSFHIHPQAEITLEANPGTVTGDFMTAAVQCGINRISLGLQSACDDELKRLGRIHTFDDFCESYRIVREAGIKNINVDLMSALPGQDVPSWERTLKKVLAMAPEHISAYSLIIEEGTPFYEAYPDTCGRDDTAENGDFAHSSILNHDAGHRPWWAAPLPDEDAERRMYHRTKELLKSCGYDRYEISNYAGPGFQCRHNIGYWRRREYLGLGLGASSLMRRCRFKNTSDFDKYMVFYGGPECRDAECIKKLWTCPEKFLLLTSYEEFQPLTLTEEMEEFMFLGLRMMCGVRLEDFRRCFQREMTDVYGDVIKKHCSQGLLQMECDDSGQGILCLTETGIDVSNYVLADFIL